MVAPDFFECIFQATGVSRIVLDGLVLLAVVVLLFIAGLEVDLHIVWKQGKQALLVSFFALVIPFLAGFAVSYFIPGFFGVQQQDVIVFSLFMATIMGMTALPVIVRILMDLSLMKTNMGMLIVASAMIVDLLCWMIFSVILSMMGTNHQAHSVTQTILMTFGFALLMLTVGRGLLNRALPWVNRSLAWPGGILSLSMALCFLASALTEYIGIHAIFGAFIMGVVLGDSEHFSERAKEIVHQFINNIFAPLFFVSIGLYINVLVSFDFWVVAVVLLIAFFSKAFGATLGARFGGLNTTQSLAVGMGMNTHGTLEVILGALALQAGLITEEVFVAILITVLITIVISAPLIRYCIDLDNRSGTMKKIMYRIFREKTST
jgi:Kef-type K+ transport system membrane component KefB